jgi:hypothetical protein
MAFKAAILCKFSAATKCLDANENKNESAAEKNPDVSILDYCDVGRGTFRQVFTII